MTEKHCSHCGVKKGYHQFYNFTAGVCHSCWAKIQEKARKRPTFW